MYFKEPETQAQAVVIWLHGLGSNPQDMEGLALELRLEYAVRHIFLAAPIRPVTINHGMHMPAWYDIYGSSLNDREDYSGISQSQAIVHEVLSQQIEEGIASQSIYIAGFSQGAAIALYSALSFGQNLGGVMALSGYLPCQAHLQIQQNQEIPIFMGIGQFDDVVLPKWTNHASEYIQKSGFKHIQHKEYPMGHSVCTEEVRDISQWLNVCIQAQQNKASEVL